MSLDASLINRVKKLLALGTNNPDIHEAEAAMAKAQELIARHNIQEAFLKVETGDTTQATVITKIIHQSGRVATWLTLLSETVGEVNGCICYFVSKQGIFAVGTDDDIALVALLLDYLENEVTNACKAACRQRSMTKGEGRIFANRFKLGATDALVKRLREVQKRITAEVKELPKGNYALAIISTKLELAKAAAPKLTTVKSRFRENLDGYTAGVAAGNRINLKPNSRTLVSR